MKEKIKLALIGCGGIGEGVHMPAYANMDNVEMVYGYEPFAQTFHTAIQNVSMNNERIRNPQIPKQNRLRRYIYSEAWNWHSDSPIIAK